MTIFSEGFDAVVEALYSKAELSPYLAQSDTVVNPTNDKFYGKTVIINMPIEDRLLNSLMDSNTILSRIPLNTDRPYDYQPYDDRALKINPSINSNMVYSSKYFKQIKCLLLKDQCFVETAKRIEDIQVESDLTVLGLINKYIKDERS